MSWLEALISWLRQFWPLDNMQPWQRGVKITYYPADIDIEFQRQWPFVVFTKIPATSFVADAADGMHWVTPFMQELKKENVMERVMDLLPQTVTLKDGTQVSFSANITYEITDARRNILRVHSFRHSLEAAARIHLAKRLRQMQGWSDLVSRQDWLEERLSETLTTRSKRWGVKIIEVGFTDLSKSKTYRLLSDAQAASASVMKEEWE